MRRAALVLASVLVAAACSGGSDDTSRPSIQRDPKPVAVDYSGTPLGKVPGTTTTSEGPETGMATIVGTVTGPGGVVSGATVRTEHLLGGDVVTRDAITGPDGRYAIAGVPGGRYRIRAFQAPALAQVEPIVLFLEDGRESSIDLAVTDQRRVVARSAVAPAPPYVDEPVNLSVVVAAQEVDADGVVRSRPISGLPVELDGLGAWTLRREANPFRPPTQPRLSTTTSTTSPSSAREITDGTGTVRFALQCNRSGPPRLTLLVVVSVVPPAVEGEPPPIPQQRMERLDLSVPDCVDPEVDASTTSTTRDAPNTTSDPEDR